MAAVAQIEYTRLQRFARKLLRDRRGTIAMLFAATTPVLVGSVGLGIDTIQWSVAKRQMQRKADSGALAGAYALAQGASVSSMVSTDIVRNDSIVLTDTDIENAPTAGPMAGNAAAVRVALRGEMTLPFSQLFLDDAVGIEAEATAQVVSNGDFCAISLENGNTTGINMTGNSTVDLACGMATNSVAANAVSAGGSSQVKATPIMAVGGLPPSSNYAAGTVRIPYSVAQRDPFASLPSSFSLGTNKNGNVGSNRTVALTPGTYNNFKIQGTANLSPGIYYINGTDFDIGAQAVLNGTGVIFILTGPSASNIAEAKVNGGAKLNITAPTSGTYAGVLFYQDRRANSGPVNKINGNSTSKLQGAIYFPKQELQFSGTAGMDIKCIQMVARRLTFTGNSTVTNVCPPGSGAQAFKGTAVRLVA